MTTALVPEFTVADRLAKARQVTGMTQAQFATELGLNLKTYQRLERGEREAPRALLIGAAITSGVSVSWLVTGHADDDAVTRDYLDQLSLDLCDAA